jgi:predicted  nucleic acid-binding Zn-ribbon protein
MFGFLRKKGIEMKTEQERIVELEKELAALRAKIAKIGDIEGDVASMSLTIRHHEEDITRIKENLNQTVAALNNIPIKR